MHIATSAMQKSHMLLRCEHNCNVLIGDPSCLVALSANDWAMVCITEWATPSPGIG